MKCRWLDCGWCYCPVLDKCHVQAGSNKCLGYNICEQFQIDGKHEVEVLEGHGASVVIESATESPEVDAETRKKVEEYLGHKAGYGRCKGILMDAYTLTRGDRNEDYGHPLDDFSKTAKMWSAVFGVEVTAEQVALAMVCVKISRQLNAPKRDNLVDGAGYFSTIEMIEQERKQRGEDASR